MENQKNYKLIFLGNSSVGKSCLILRIIEDRFDPDIGMTCGTAFYAKEYKKHNIKLNIWDTCGQEKFQGINTLYYRDADIIIFVVDITDNESFKGFEFYYNEVLNKGPANPLLVLLLNKIDLFNKIDNIFVDNYIREVKEKYQKVKIIEKVSAFQNKNINETMEKILESAKHITTESKSKSLLKYDATSDKKKKICCN